MNNRSQSIVSVFLQVVRRLYPYLREDRLVILLVVMGMFSFTAVGTAMIWYLGKPINQLQAGQYDELTHTLIILAILVIVNQSIWLINTIASNFVSLRFIGRLRQALLDLAMQISFPLNAKYSRGDLIARLSNDVDQTEIFVFKVPIELVAQFITLILYSAMIVWIDLDLAIIVLMFAPVFYFHQRYYGPRKGRVADRFFNNNGKLLGFEDQTLSNLRGISSFNSQSLMHNMHGKAYELARIWAMKMRSIDAWYAVTFSLATYGCGIIIIYVGIDDIQNGDLNVGQLVSFLLYLGYLAIPVRTFAQAPIQWHGSLGAVKRVLMLFDEKPQVSEVDNAVALKVSAGKIACRDLSFSYANGEQIFDRVNIDIPAGETWAIVGPSGSGKSTLARLLLRFYNPGAGDISIDDTNISNVSLSSLRDAIAIVWQDPFVINDTIAANLRLAKYDATEEELIAACKNSQAWEFISESEQGLASIIGAEGVELSAGQYQRLSIAQAFLRDANILILDEASSALDSKSEQAIVKAINDLRCNRTTLIIAHRYSSIRLADKVMYLNGDGSVSIGTHAELLQQHPGYKEAVEWQTGSLST